MRQRARRNTGRLLERGLAAAFPSTPFPFAVRLNVDMLAADGSEAMTALSAASLALADAGVPITAHVAGGCHHTLPAVAAVLEAPAGHAVVMLLPMVSLLLLLSLLMLLLLLLLLSLPLVFMLHLQLLSSVCGLLRHSAASAVCMQCLVGLMLCYLCCAAESCWVQLRLGLHLMPSSHLSSYLCILLFGHCYIWKVCPNLTWGCCFCPAGTQVAAFVSKGHLHALDWHPTASQTDSEPNSNSYEIVVDPQEVESSFSDMLLQVVGTKQGITGLHVDTVQKGGVPFEVVASALAAAWQSLQQQHRKMTEIRNKVSSALLGGMI